MAVTASGTQPSAMFCLTHPSARTAFTLPMLAKRVASIGVRMAVFAYRLGSVCSGKRVAPHEILAQRDRFHMGRIDTASISAEMVDLETVRNLPNHEAVCYTMGKHVLPVNGKRAIARRKLTGCPLPAIARFIDLRPKPFYVQRGLLALERV